MRRRSHSTDAAAPLDAEAWVGRLIDWDGQRTLVPEALQAFGEYVAAACIPDPAPEVDGSVPPLPPAVLHLRRTVAALARRALGRALS